MRLNDRARRAAGTTLHRGLKEILGKRRLLELLQGSNVDNVILTLATDVLTLATVRRTR